MTVRTYATSALLGMIVVLPRLAVAQAQVPRVSIAAGAGLAVPLHGDFDFTPWAWDADVRVAMSRHALFEAAVGEWRHSETFVRQNIPVTPGPGVIGRSEQRTTRTQRTLEANVLFTGAHGRVRMTAGGGVGLLEHRRRTRTLLADCSPAVECGTFESTFSSASGSAQGVGGAEVRLSRAAALYGQVRFVVPFIDPGGSDLRVTTGVRIGFGS
ncbi:MAG: hypothetical protein ABI652_07705 [Acidobacteriota bacterium]